MVTRREFLQRGSLAGAGFFVSGQWRVPLAYAATLPVPGAQIQKWAMRLPLPTAMPKAGMVGGVDYYSIPVTQFQQQVLPSPQFGPTTLWGYGGTFPARTIEARVGTPVRVRWSNELGSGGHLLPVDHTPHGTYSDDPASGDPINGWTPDRRIVTHLHGGEVPAASDGFPDAWYTSDGEAGPGVPAPEHGETLDYYYYPNSQQSAMLWYHDHAIGITRLNVYAGMAGFYALRNPDELRPDGSSYYGLPSGPYEIPIVIQDRRFDTSGQLFFPRNLEESLIPFPPVPGAPDPTIVPEFAGDVSVVNGAAWPVADVEPRLYRLRFLNGSGSRFYHLSWVNPVNGKALKIPTYQIGTDGGFLPAPVEITPKNNQGFLLAPAERFDLLVDFGAVPAGTEVVLWNDAGIPFSLANRQFTLVDPGKPGVAPLFEIMKFRVSKSRGADDPAGIHGGTFPALTLPPFQAFPTTPVAGVRPYTLLEGADVYGRIFPLLGDAAAAPRLWHETVMGLHQDDPAYADLSFARGQGYLVELWNLSMDYHPIHFHLRQFQVVNRQFFGVPVTARGVLPPQVPQFFTSNPIAPDANETGWKDTVAAPPGAVTRIRLDFPADTFPGLFPWHCHILDHEDHEMMLVFKTT